MPILSLIPSAGILQDSFDEKSRVFPSFGFYNSSSAQIPFLRTATDSNVGTVTATVGVTTNLIVDASDIIYYYISTSATAPSTADLIAGTGAIDYGNDTTPTLGANTFNANGLTSNTAYYTHFYQTTSNGNSIILTSSSFATLDATDVYASASVLNSLTSTEETTMIANVTTPNDANYLTTLFYYKEYGSSIWLSAGSGLPTYNTTGNFEIAGLTSGKTYELFVVAVDQPNYKQSLPSSNLAVTTGSVQSEEELFLDNLKEIISQSSTFQTWTGTANSTDAKAFIYKRWDDSPSGKYAIIDLESNSMDKFDNTNTWSVADMTVLLVDDTVASYETRDSQAELVTFSTTTGKMIVEINDLEGISGNLVIQNISLDEKHSFGERDFEDNDLVMMVKYNITTGV